MSTSLVALLLAGNLQGPPVVHGGGRAPQGWAALVRGQLWVCWREGEGCWRRVESAPWRPDADELDDDELVDAVDELDAAPGRRSAPNDLERLAFANPDELIVVDASGQAWDLRRGDELLRPLPGGLPLEVELAKPPRRLVCSPTGTLPVHDGHAWGWVEAPCGITTICARRVPRLGRAPAGGLELDVGISLALTRAHTQSLDRDWLAQAPATSQAFAVQVLATVSLAFDPRAGAEQRRRWRALGRAAATPIALPTMAAGPLADAELAATHAAVCRSTS